MLFVPTFRARVVGGIITYFLNSILHEFKFCTLGKDNSQMAEEVPRGPDMYYVSSDGKAHDSHMHASLIQRWVHPLFKEFKHIFNHEFITLGEFEMVFKNIDTRFESIQDGKVQCSGVLHGTITSGLFGTYIFNTIIVATQNCYLTNATFATL